MESEESKSPNGSRPEDGRQTLGERIDRVSDTAHEAWSRTRDAFGDLEGTLDIKGRVGRHPYGTLAAALGIGYVLGGGLFSRLTARLIGTGLRLGMRLAALPLIKDELVAFVERMDTEHEETGSRGRRRTTRHANTNEGRQP